MSLDPSKLPHEQFIPGRQEAIDHAGRIDRLPFTVSAGIFFGTAILCVISRLAIRIFGRRAIRLDDGIVVFACLCLISAFGVLTYLLNLLYLVEAINKKAIIPFQEDLPKLLITLKWATIFAALNWTAVYMVKFAFLYFFHTLIVGLSPRITRFYWVTVFLSVIFWIYTVLGPVIICPHYGASTVKCSANPHQHTRSLVGNLLVACMDITTDLLIVAVPILVLNKSMMPTKQKISIAAMLCLSAAMIVCALIRLVGSIVDTTPTGSGTAPVWATYWSFLEACFALIMTSVIVIRGVFITNLINEDRRQQDSLMHRFGRALLDTLRLSGSSGRSSRRSPQRSGYSNTEDQAGPSAPPRIATQGLTRGTFNGVKTFISGGKKNHDTIKSVDTAYVLEDLDYHNIRKKEATRPTPGSDSSQPSFPSATLARSSREHSRV